MKITKRQRQELHEKYDGHCAYCGCELQKGWHADHFEPLQRQCTRDGKIINIDRDVLPNMMPSCPSCNRMKSDFTIEQFRKNIQNYINSLNTYNVQYKFARKYGLVKETDTNVVFYFEKEL